MIQADDITLGCRCTECGERCTACLGTNSVISRDKLKDLENDPRFMLNPFNAADMDDEEDYFSGYDGFEDYSD